MQTAKIDLRKEMKRYYAPQAGKAEVVIVPRLQFLMADGKGEPAGPMFQEAVQAIYGVAYTLKFSLKKTMKRDFTMMPMEGLWWMKDGEMDMKRRGEWLWTVMIMVPEFVTKTDFDRAVGDLARKKNPPGLENVRLDWFEEGTCVQTMHVGPYSEEGPSIERLLESAREGGYGFTGKHHEIYMGDPRRSAPSKLRTILRHPVSRMHR